MDWLAVPGSTGDVDCWVGVFVDSQNLALACLEIWWFISLFATISVHPGGGSPEKTSLASGLVTQVLWLRQFLPLMPFTPDHCQAGLAGEWKSQSKVKSPGQ